MVFFMMQNWLEQVNKTSIKGQLFDGIENLPWMSQVVLAIIAIVVLAILAVGAAGAILYPDRSLCSLH